MKRPTSVQQARQRLLEAIDVYGSTENRSGYHDGYRATKPDTSSSAHAKALEYWDARDVKRAWKGLDDHTER